MALHLGPSSAERQGPTNLVQQTQGAHKMGLMSFCLLSSFTNRRGKKSTSSRFKPFHLEDISAVRNIWYDIKDNPNHLQLMFVVRRLKLGFCFVLNQDSCPYAKKKRKKA